MPTIETSSIFSKIIEYHEDGVAFWQKYGVHHPFLLPDYPGDRRKDGCPYHRNFSKIGFKPEHASQVSFVELLNVPTVGRNELNSNDFDTDHLKWLNALIVESNIEHIFISQTVESQMQKTRVFPLLNTQTQDKEIILPRLFSNGTKNIYKHLHFSCYVNKKMKDERVAILNLIT